MPTFADIIAKARELVDMTDAEWDTSLAKPGVDGRALDALNRATEMLANGLTKPGQRVEDVDKATLRTHQLWTQTAAEREAYYREALGRVYGE